MSAAAGIDSRGGSNAARHRWADDPTDRPGIPCAGGDDGATNQPVVRTDLDSQEKQLRLRFSEKQFRASRSERYVTECPGVRSMTNTCVESLCKQDGWPSSPQRGSRSAGPTQAFLQFGMPFVGTLRGATQIVAMIHLMQYADYNWTGDLSL